MLESVIFLHLLGASYHPQVDHLNERNWGVGASVELDRGPRYQTTVGADVYRDSYSNIAGHVAYTKEWWHGEFAVGYAAGLEYRPNGAVSNVIPLVVPMVSIGTQEVRARFTYVPQVAGPESEVVAGQLVIQLND